jgi:molybdenum cofactor biosynthesis enzyme MoaA
MAKAIFDRTLRLQIGCGAEPTLFKYNPELIQLAKKHGIRYISLTTNANLLNKESIKNLLESGLDELTISLHGVNQNTYEHLMTNASYTKLIEVLHILSIEKLQYPHFKLRLNYTVNNLNVNELGTFFDVFGAFSIDILQLRTLRDIGGDIRLISLTESFNQSLKESLYSLKTQCEKRAIVFIPPDDLKKEDLTSNSNTIKSFAYGYISPKVFLQPDFNWQNETFNQYSKRANYSFKLFKELFTK